MADQFKYALSWRCLKPTIWPNCGICHASLCVRIMDMAWVHLLNVLPPLLNTTQEEITFLELKYVARLDQIESFSFPSFFLILFLLFLLFLLSLLLLLLDNMFPFSFFSMGDEGEPLLTSALFLIVVAQCCIYWYISYQNVASVALCHEKCLHTIKLLPIFGSTTTN